MIQSVSAGSFGRTSSMPHRSSELRRPVGLPNVLIRPVVPFLMGPGINIRSDDAGLCTLVADVSVDQTDPPEPVSRRTEVRRGLARGRVALPVVASSAGSVERPHRLHAPGRSPIRSLAAVVNASRRYATLRSLTITPPTSSRRRRWSTSRVTPLRTLHIWIAS